MARYIDMDALQAEIEKPLAVTSNHEINWANKMAHDLMLRWLQITPAADVAPVRYGQWIEEDSFLCTHFFTCSECGEDLVTQGDVNPDYVWKYCPSCGAKMDGEE